MVLKSSAGASVTDRTAKIGSVAAKHFTHTDSASFILQTAMTNLGRGSVAGTQFRENQNYSGNHLRAAHPPRLSRKKAAVAREIRRTRSVHNAPIALGRWPAALQTRDFLLTRRNAPVRHTTIVTARYLLHILIMVFLVAGCAEVSHALI